MEQRRKIVISTGTDGEETLSTPHFDTEATLAARPVVPLAEPAAPPTPAYAVPHGAGYAPRAEASSPWKRSTFIMIILAAVTVGIASGLAIGLYQSRKKAPAPIVEQPSVNQTEQATTQMQPETPPTQVSQPEPEQAAVTDAEDSVKPPVAEADDDAAEDRQRDSRQRDDKQAERDNPKRDEERVSPVVPPRVVRERQADEPVLDEREERRAQRERRREERREERRAERRRQREENDDYPLSVPRNVERARQEINRIRDIFEGRQP